MFLQKRNKAELNRPVIKLELGPADLILEILAIISLLAFLGFTLYYYSRLPDTIPTHFDTAGNPDGYSGKDTFWAIPAVAFVFYTILTLFNRVPEKFNFPVKITPANVYRQYLLAVRLIRYLKLTLVLMFFFITFKTVMVAVGKSGGLGIWFMPVFIGIIVGPLILYFILAQQSR